MSASFSSLSFIGRRRGGRYRKFWCAGISRNGETMGEIGRARADEFLKYMAGHPDRGAILARIVRDMRSPLGPMEVAFLARLKEMEAVPAE